MIRWNPVPGILVLTALTAGCCHRQGCNGTAAATVTALAAKPAAYAGRTVTVTGRLDNAGSSYFTDLRLVLTDGGSSVPVRPWLPLEAPPSRPGGGGHRPAVLSDYLGKRLRITGCLRPEGPAHLLEVQQADIIMEDDK
jgi:hypothetical protein